jgi:hypothetical protein
MTTVATRARRIAELDGFDIIVKFDGVAVPLSDNSVLGSYPYEKMAMSAWTVADWKAKRFEAVYAGYSCDVLREDGSVASARTTLATIRESYSE